MNTPRIYLVAMLLLSLLSGNAFARITRLKTIVLANNEPVPDSNKPKDYEFCYDVVKNGKFEKGNLKSWMRDNGDHCTMYNNFGQDLIRVNDTLTVGVAPLANSSDALVVPQQGYGLDQTCSLKQDVSFKAASQILYAQLSWADRITTQANQYNDDQYTKISVTVMDANPDTPDIPEPVFITTTENTETNSTMRKVRIYDATTSLENMADENDMVNLVLKLEEEAFDAPIFFQWDNVELWVCFKEKGDPSVTGDPHFTTWTGDHYTYNGACDLVLMHAPDFSNGLGLDIHIRTSQHQSFSYISHAAVRIGDDIFEVVGNAQRDYYLNGELKPELVATLVGGFPVTRHVLDDNMRRVVYTIDLGDDSQIIVRSWKEFVTVKIHNARQEDFGNSVGLMGDFLTGSLLARDGVTVINDIDAFGTEWQVGNTQESEIEDDFIFQTLSMPQYPQQCILPAANKDRRRRRLGEMRVTKEMADAACAHIEDPSEAEFCAYDVMMTNDLSIVGAY